MTDQHDARDDTTELLAWFTEADGFNQGTKAPHKWVLRAEQELRRLAATQPTKPEPNLSDEDINEGAERHGITVAGPRLDDFQAGVRWAELVVSATNTREEDEYVIHRMGQLLAEIAVAIKGTEPVRRRWGYEGLPGLVMELVSFKQAVLDPENQPSQFGTSLLAAAPSQSAVQPLSEAQAFAISAPIFGGGNRYPGAELKLVRAIERAHGIGTPKEST